MARILIVCIICLSFLTGCKRTPTEIPDFQVIKALLENGKYEEVDSLFSACQKDYEEKIIGEEVIVDLFDNFDSTDMHIEDLTTEWIKLIPDSYSAYLARGIYYTNMGWLSRGYAYIDTTKKEQFDEMADYFSKAEKDLLKALELNPKLIVAYGELMSISMVGGKGKGERYWLEKAEQIDPSSFLIRKTYMYSLQPKWGGSLEEMKAFVGESEQYFAENPKLKILIGYIPYSIADMIKNKNRVEAIPYFDLAIEQGDYSFFYFERGKNYYKLKRYDEALKDFNRVINDIPRPVKSLRLRADINFEKGNTESAYEDIEKALKLDPLEPEVLTMYGHFLYSQRKFKEAEEKWRLALVYGEYLPYTASNMGLVTLYLKKYKEAEKYLARALELKPTKSDYWYNYGHVNSALGRKCKMVEAQKKYMHYCELEGYCHKEKFGRLEFTIPVNCSKLSGCKACKDGYVVK